MERLEHILRDLKGTFSGENYLYDYLMESKGFPTEVINELVDNGLLIKVDDFKYAIEKVEVGDSITAQGCTYKIAEIISCDHWGVDAGWYVEFLDPQGKYHYWKQGSDGGRLIKAR